MQYEGQGFDLGEVPAGKDQEEGTERAKMKMEM